MKYYHGVFVCIWLLIGSGCITIQVPPQSAPRGDSLPPLRSLNHAHELFQKGHYADAEKTYGYVIETYSLDPIAGDAQIGLAFTLLYFENPKRDNSKALGEFKRFIKQYPMHPRLKEAKNMVNLLKGLITQQLENQRLKDDLQRLIDIDIQTEKKRKETQEGKKKLQKKDQ